MFNVTNQLHGDKVMATLDLSSAFNMVDRSAFRSAVRGMVPALAPWVDLCHSRPSMLCFGGHRLRSSRGIQQGDPLDPALFGMAIDAPAREATAQVISEF